MRTLALASLLLVFSATAGAQDEPAEAPAEPTRVEVQVEALVEGTAERDNPFQYFLWERLNHFGLRVDSLNETKWDSYITRADERWQEQFPEAAPAALRIEGGADTEYDNSEFYGQPQAHNFHGEIEVLLKDAAGETIATFAFSHSWGRLPASRSKSQTRREYNQMVFTGVVLAVLACDPVRSAVPESRREDLDEFVRSQVESTLRTLEGSNLGDGELANLLRSLSTEPGEGDGEGE